MDITRIDGKKSVFLELTVAIEKSKSLVTFSLVYFSLRILFGQVTSKFLISMTFPDTNSL